MPPTAQRNNSDHGPRPPCLDAFRLRADVDALAEKTLFHMELSGGQLLCVHTSVQWSQRSADQRQVTDKQTCLTVALFSADVKKHPLSWRPCAVAISDRAASVPRWNLLFQIFNLPIRKQCWSNNAAFSKMCFAFFFYFFKLETWYNCSGMPDRRAFSDKWIFSCSRFLMLLCSRSRGFLHTAPSHCS